MFCKEPLSLPARHSNTGLLSRVASSLGLLAMRLRRAVKAESGQALPLALILLMLGGFLVIPTLALITTNLTAVRVVDRANLELYAADAGVEQVLWHIKHDMAFTIPAEGNSHEFDSFEVNGKTVEPSIAKNTGETVYEITSTATSPDGHETTVHAYIEPFDLAFLLDSAITSDGDIEISPNVTISGNVTYNGTIDNKGTIIGETINADSAWPDPADLAYFYWLQVKDLTPYPADTINCAGGTLETPIPFGPLYRVGDLQIEGNGWGRVDGTVYVTGNFIVKPNPFIDMNGQTIIAEGTITIQPGATLTGSGCLISLNKNNETVACDIQPNMTQDPDDFILIMAVQGQVFLKPGGDFFGCIAGEALVDLQPGSTLYWREVGEGELNFPDENSEGWRIARIITYTIE